MKKLLIFTDLDGTLLDHHDYSWHAAEAALSRIAQRGIPLMFNSSKTCSEILQLRRQLDNRHPFIVENGSALYIPEGYFRPGGQIAHDRFESHFFAAQRNEILSVLQFLRKQFSFNFRGFSDMTSEVLASETGLSLEAAQKANQRDCSEPLQWLGSDRELEEFREALEPQGFKLLRGGRFHHVMGETDKGESVRWLIRRYREAWPEHDFISVALGDSPNDQAMLETADIPVVIEPAAGDPLKLVDSKPVIYAGAQGPVGWQLAMDRILEDIPD